MNKEIEKYFDNKNFIDSLKFEKYDNKKTKILEVYLCDGITYISKEDFIKYETKERKSSATISNEDNNIELVVVSQEEIDEICNKYFLKAQLNLLKSKDLEFEPEKSRNIEKKLTLNNLVEGGIEIEMEMEM